MDDTTKAIIASILRHGLTTLGGALVTHGLIQSNQTETFVAGGMVLLGAAWAWWQKQGQAEVASLLKKVTNRPTTASAVVAAQAVPPGSAVTPGLPAKPL